MSILATRTKPVFPRLQFGHPHTIGLLGAWLFYEGESKVVHDLLGQSDATWNSTAATWIGGRDGHCAQFGTSSQNFFNAGDVLDLGYLGPISVFARVQWYTVTGNRAIIGKQSRSSPFGGWAFSLNSGKPHFEYFNNWNTNYFSAEATSGLSTINWGDVGVSYKSNTAAFYLNGRQLTTSYTAQTANGDIDTSIPLCIGGRDPAGTQDSNWHGTISCVYLWGREISAQEHEQLAQDPYAMCRRRRVIEFFTGISTGTTSTAAVSLGGLTIAGAAIEELAGQAALDLSGITIAGAGTHPHLGAGAITLDAATIAAAGAEEISAAGAIDLSAVTLAGIGAHPVIGAGTIALDPVAVAAEGDVAITGAAGSGALTLSPAEISANGTEEISGSGTVVLTPVTVSVSGLLEFIAAGEIVLSPAAIAGLAVERFAATAALTFEPLSITASGQLSVTTGAGAITLDAPTLSAAALIDLPSFGAITLDGVVLSATGGAPIAAAIADMVMTFTAYGGAITLSDYGAEQTLTAVADS